MKNLKTILLCLLIGFNAVISYSQTAISGMIDTDSVLRKTDSPFFVTSDLVISPDGQITIEPGVEVRFASGIKLEVRGTLIANGTMTDSITFTSNSGVSKGSWYGIDIKNTQGGNAKFDYCNFKYASTAINEECCWGGTVSVKNSSFLTNITAIGGYSGKITPVDSCYFSGNTYCLTNADKAVTNCIFENNEYGLYQTERISVSNSTFTNHTQVALYGGRGTVSNCTIENNNIGIKAFFEGFTVKNSTISNNDTGIELGDYDGYIASIDSNQICNNTTYNIKNNSSYNTELYTNCWCNSDSTTVEDKIYDGWDNSNKGLVDYTLYMDNCMTPIFKSVKLENRVIYFKTGISISEKSGLYIYPNPTRGILIIQGANNISNVKIYSYSGILLINQNFDYNEKIEINLSDLNSGIYFIELYQDGKTRKEKIIKVK